MRLTRSETMALPWLIGAAVVAAGVAIKKALDSNDTSSDNNDEEEARRQQEQEAKKQRKRQNLEKKINNLEQEFYASLPEFISSATQIIGVTQKSQPLEASIKAIFPLTTQTPSNPQLMGSIVNIGKLYSFFSEDSKFEEEFESYHQEIEKESQSEYAAFLRGTLKFSSNNSLHEDSKLEEDFSKNILLIEKLLGHEINLIEEDRKAFIKIKNSIETIDRYSKIKEDLTENA